jgi:hypothetical protein
VGLTAIEPSIPISSVWPSAGARVASSVPIAPDAPGRFSTTTCLPQVSASFGATSRASRSDPPPAE